MTRSIQILRRLKGTSLLLMAIAMVSSFAPNVLAQQASISAWDAADFRIWGFVPYWTSQSQVNSFPADGVYSHVSDVLYFSGVRPTASGDLNYHSRAAQHLASLKSHAASEGFRLHMSMFDTAGGTVEQVWNSITSNPTNRANFVSNLVDLMDDNNMVGFNFDWERPNTVSEWANYTQLAKDLKAAIGPDREISVDDYGFADSRWDDSPVFDARTYDQLFIMGYHYPADDGTSLDHQTFAATKLALTGQGAHKAFKDEQLVLGIGTWGANGPATVSLKNIVGVNPNLPADATTFTGTVTDISGTSRTGTWDIESRYQVRDKVQLALDRNMPGVMSWTLHYDATGPLSLHRVAHHYTVFQRDIPDVNLDGLVNATDAEALADNMGSVPGWTGTNTDARFEDFYISGNWEQGDHNGNGFVNQQDADWLADRFSTLGVDLPDRLAYSGNFENFADAQGVAGRWQSGRDTSGNLDETGNFQQHGSGFMSFTGNGIGADKHSNNSLTVRNQNVSEAFDTLNTEPRTLHVDLDSPIDLNQQNETYVTFLVRQNTAPLLSGQQSSLDRELSLQFLDAAGENQFDFAFHGTQQQFSARSQADSGGEDVAANGFAPDTTYLFVGKISGNGANANQMQAALFADGETVGHFADITFPWMVSAEGSTGFNPLITQLQFQSLFEANTTISNVWVGAADEFFESPPGLAGDYNGNGVVDAADYTVWRDSFGSTVDLAADGDGSGEIDAGDYTEWVNHFGESSALSATVPEPSSLLLGAIATVGLLMRRTHYVTAR